MESTSFSSRICGYAKETLDLSQDDYEKMKYAMETLLGESSKLILLFILFFACDLHLRFLFAVMALSLIRMNTGGLHFKTYWGCLGFSAVFFGSALLLDAYMPLSQAVMMGIGALALAVTAAIAPVTSPNRPVYTHAERMRFRVTGCFVIGLHLLGFWAIKNNPYFTISVWVIFLQAIQLYIAKEVENHEKKSTV